MRQTTADSNAPAKSKPRLRKFHIGTGQSDQEVIDQFVVRQNELDRILEVLAGNIDSDSCQHLLLVGPRGRGKTMLLVRVIAELHIDAHLAEGLLPVRLMEESQEIFTLADFWLECLYFLAKACEPIDQAIAEDLRASHAALTAQWADPALESRARASVLDAADRLDRKLVIMIENLQALSREADSTFGWDLRQVLQTEPQVMLLATATSHFAALEDAEQPFFELFRTLHLPPLDTEECRQLWQAISHERVDTRQIRPLRILTGGSPRLMVVLAGFSRDRSLRQLMDHLVELIDDHTEYFRSHIEDLASSERRVYLALIDLWQESSSAEIAARARMDIRKVSTYLGRLVERGAVLVEGTGRNRSYYAAERLYSIYYKLRRDRDEAAVVRNLIHFMVTYYHGTELTELSRRLVLEAKQSAGIREGLARAAQEDAELRNLLQAQGMQVPQMADRRLAARNISASELSGESLLSEGAVGAEAADTLDQMRRLYESGDFEAMIRLADAFVAADLDHPAVDPAVEARLVSLKAQAQLESGDSAAAIETYDALLARFGDSALPKVQVQLARAMVNKGYSQGQLGDSAAEIETYDALLARFGDSALPEVQVQLAWAMVNKGDSQGQLGDSAAEIETYDALLARFGDSALPEVQVQLARAMFNKGITQGQLGDSAAAIETYDALLARFGDSALPEVQVQLAWAMVNKGVTQRQLGDSAAAIETYDALLARFGDSALPEVQESVAMAMVNKGYSQGQLGDSAAEIETYDALLARFGDSALPEVQVWLARAMVNKGYSQRQLGDSAAEIETYDALLARFGDSALPEVQVQLAWAMFNKGVMQGQLGDSAAEIETYDALLARFGDSALPEVQVQLAMAMVNKGYSQGQLGDSAAEIETYDALLARFGDSALPEVQESVAMAMVNKGYSQGQLGDSAAEIETYDALLARFGDSVVTEGQESVAMAMFNKGVTQRQLGDSAAAIETYDALLARFGDSALPEVQESVAMAMVNKGYSQGQLGDSAAEIETYDALLARFGDSALPELQDAVGMVTRNIAERLCMLGDAAAALQRAQALRTLASRQTATEPLLHADWVEAMARALLGETTRVEALFRGILSRFDGDDQQMVHDFQKTVPTLVALGADPGSLAGVLEEYPHALEALRPLAVALRLEAGDKVRAPSEMLEVAEDIRAEIDEQRGQRAR